MTPLFAASLMIRCPGKRIKMIQIALESANDNDPDNATRADGNDHFPSISERQMIRERIDEITGRIWELECAYDGGLPNIYDDLVRERRCLCRRLEIT